MSDPAYSPLNPNGSSPDRKIAALVNWILSGGQNNKIEFTLRANQASTTLTDPRFSTSSSFPLTPLTANAAAAIATTYVSARASGSITLTHANNAQVDKTFVGAIGR